MRIKLEEAHSSFLSAEKDISLVLNKIFANNRIQRLLYYTTPDCLKKPDISEEEKYKLIGKNIKMVPKLEVDGSVLNYIIINFDNFVSNSSNPEFRDNVIEFDIVCHFDQWQLEDLQLRPYKIAAEIDSMINKKHLTGIGQVEFMGASQMILNSEFAGICLMYQVIHGGEDTKKMPNPENEERFLDDFEEYMDNIGEGNHTRHKEE